MKSKWVKKFVLILWTVMSIGLIIIGIKSNINNIIPLIIGTIATFIGIAKVFQRFVGWFLLDVGLGCVAIAVLEYFGIDYYSGEYMKQFFMGLSGLLAIELFFDDAIRNKTNKKRCTEAHEAKCVSFTQVADSRYVPVYKYSVNGKSAMYYGNSTSNVNPKLGEIITVFVNNKNENEVYCPTSKAILMVRYLIGMGVLVFSTCIAL